MRFLRRILRKSSSLLKGSLYLQSMATTNTLGKIPAQHLTFFPFPALFFISMQGKLFSKREIKNKAGNGKNVKCCAGIFPSVFVVAMDCKYREPFKRELLFLSILLKNRIYFASALFPGRECSHCAVECVMRRDGSVKYIPRKDYDICAFLHAYIYCLL